jgi:hypothetical protein
VVVTVTIASTLSQQSNICLDTNDSGARGCRQGLP